LKEISGMFQGSSEETKCCFEALAAQMITTVKMSLDDHFRVGSTL